MAPRGAAKEVNSMDLRWWMGLMVGLALWGCTEEGTDGASGSSQTHWLSDCSQDAECGELSCVCGSCTAACGTGGECTTGAVASTCQLADSAAALELCSGQTAVDVCLETCSDESPCPSAQRCVGGACVPGTATTEDAGNGEVCLAPDDACSVLEGQTDDDPCCEGSTCVIDTCSDAPAPAPCFGTCQAVELRWYSTCGDPVCGPPTTPDPGEGCTTEVEGETCTAAGSSCETGQCGASLVCATEDPKAQPGGCPISRARYKRDIHYVDDQQRRAYAEELLSLPLATYQYRHARAERPQLGFIIEDVEPSASVDAPRDRVDLYGYASMAVATLQVQARQMETMQQELALLRQRLAEMELQCR
jgi:hypothetical protein